MENSKIVAGRFFYGVRKDGREFIGEIASVRTLPKGTLVVVFDSDEEGYRYRSVYLENMASFNVYMDSMELSSAVCDSNSSFWA